MDRERHALVSLRNKDAKGRVTSMRRPQSALLAYPHALVFRFWGSARLKKIGRRKQWRLERPIQPFPEFSIDKTDDGNP